MKILLTGSNGFLGKEIYKNLISTNTILTLNRINSDYNYDLSKNLIVFNDSFDIVIHAAGLAHIKANNKNNHLYNEINVNGTSNLLHALSKNKLPKYFVYISSVSVYGLNEGIGINENEPLHAKDPYGLSKILAEDLVINWCNTNNIIYTILRLPLIVGDNPPGNLGSMIDAIKKGFYFNIGGGDYNKSMVLNTDVAITILKAAKVGGIYNLTDGVHPTIYNLSDAISKKYYKNKIYNLPKYLIKFIAKFGDIIGNIFPINTSKYKKLTSSLTFDDTKAKKAFGWQPTAVLETFKNL